MATYRYIRSSGIRRLVKDNNKSCGADFLNELDCFIYEAVCRAVKQFNGHRKRLDRTVAQLVIGKINT